MDNRLSQILYSLVEEYIKTGEPVSSAALARSLQMKFSAATIRNEYKRLDDEGLVSQPHTSAGRVPTDRGYRFYVDNMEEPDSIFWRRDWLTREFDKLAAEYGNERFALAVLLSRLSHALAVVSLLPEGEVAQCGLKQLFTADNEWRHVLEEASTWIDNMPAWMPELGHIGKEGTTLYIGDENPFFPSFYTSMLMRLVRRGGQPDVVVMVLGPKRMDYERNMVLVEEASQLV